MKKIINRKVYDTDTAEEIASDSSHLFSGDFGYWEETLFRTKKGAYFLYGSGGPMSKYAEPCGNNGMAGGSDIVPLSPKDAVEWLEEHDCVDELEEYFADELEEA